MSENSKRLTISVTPALKEELERAKEEYYGKQTWADMFRELVELGLNTVEQDYRAGNIQKAKS